LNVDEVKKAFNESLREDVQYQFKDLAVGVSRALVQNLY
jgi:hypothetical protein